MSSDVSASTKSDPRVPADALSGLSPALRIGLLVALSVLLNTFVGVFSGEQLSFLYKDVLKLSAGESATLGLVTGIPAYIRPFLGAASDLFPLFGFHRKSYYGISWILTAVSYFGLAFLPHYRYASVLAVVMVIVLGGNLAFVIMDAVMVTVGNPRGLVGQYQSIQQGLPLLLGLTIAGPIGGYVTQHWSYRACFSTSGIIALIIAALFALIPEIRVVTSRHAQETQDEHADRLAKIREDRSRTVIALRQAATSPGLWAVVLFVFYLIVTPGTNTAQFYYSVNVLHFSKQFLGNLRIPSSAGAVLGLVLFAAGSRRLPVRALVWGAFLLDCLGYLVLMALHDRPSGIAVAFIGSVLGQVYILSLLTLAAKACPKGVEATVYGLVVSAINLGGGLGEKLGASMYDYFGPVSHHSVTHGWFGLLWFGFAFTVVAFVFIPFLPEWAKSNEPLRPKKIVEA